MELLFAVLLIGIIQIGGLYLLARFHAQVMQEQVKMVKVLAVFKKADNVGNLAAMVDLTEEQKQGEHIQIQQEEQFYPEELSDEALANIRATM